MITDEPTADGGQDYLYKFDPSRDVIVAAAPIPGSGLACASSPGPQGIWIGCADADYITLINRSSLRPVESLRVDSGGFSQAPDDWNLALGVPGPYPARAGGPWLCSTFVLSLFHAVVVPSGLRTRVQPCRWIAT